MTDHPTEPIKQDIDAIRDSLTDKVELLESKVRGSVENTVETVKRQFDLKQQVSDRPWTAFGLAIAAGYVVGTLGDDDGRSSSYSSYQAAPMRYYAQNEQHDAGRAAHSSGQAESNQPSGGYSAASPALYAQSYSAPSYDRGGSGGPGNLINSLFGQFGDEFNTIANAAIAAAVGMLRETVKEALPQFGSEYDRLKLQHEARVLVDPSSRSGNPGSSYGGTNASSSYSNAGGYSGASSSMGSGTAGSVTGTAVHSNASIYNTSPSSGVGASSADDTTRNSGL